MSKGFGQLASLQSLNMYRCFALGSLPESESQLASHFLISNFGNLMPEGFGDLPLTELDLGGCKKLDQVETLLSLIHI